MASKLPNTTIRDFGGGWNTSDSDLNLNSRFQPISDNVIRGVDGSFGPRQGVRLEADFATGTLTELGSIELDFGSTNESAKINIAFDAAHGLANGNHIHISGLIADIGGIPFDEINGTHSILVVNATNISIYVRVAATSTVTAARTVTVSTDTHLLGGDIIHQQYFNRRLICFTNSGEIGTMQEDGTLSRIWGMAEAEALSPGLIGTRRCTHWSSDTFKSSVIACNGRIRDKPLQINDEFEVEFLVDKGTSSNNAVPRADYVVCMQGYVILICTEYGDPFVELSAKGTDGTFTRETNPADSAELDLSMVTSSIEPVLLGAAPIRDKLYTAFYDKGMIGTLNVYDSSGNHIPDFNDTISENGTVSHRTMVSLGNDVLMCDYAGVPSVGISQQSGIYQPIRLSELIAPSLQAHLSALDEETLRTKSYAIFNRNDRSYMLFLPIYDEVTRTLDNDPIQFNDELRELNYCVMYLPQHRLFEDSNILIEGALDIGTLTADNINGVRRVVSVINQDSFVVELGGAPLSADDTSGGGSSITITPINDETIGYIFEYNKEFKIRRWTRYRYWDFECGCSSQRGKVFFAKGLKIYRMGDNEVPLYADYINDYDSRQWAQGDTYPAGYRIYDSVSGSVFQTTQEHTPTALTFTQDRADNEDVWTEYKGIPIRWQMETPWSDMRDRGGFKVVHYINIDSIGNGRFKVASFVNRLRRNPATNELSPYREMEFQAGDTGGWSAANPQVWGSGRRTREEKVWPMRIRGKLLRWRFSGETIEQVKITSLTMYYKVGNIR